MTDADCSKHSGSPLKFSPGSKNPLPSSARDRTIVRYRSLAIAVAFLAVAITLRATIVVHIVNSAIASRHARYTAGTLLTAVMLAAPIVAYGIVTGRIARWRAWFSWPAIPGPVGVILAIAATGATYLRFFGRDPHHVQGVLSNLSAFGVLYIGANAVLEEISLRGFVLYELRARAPFLIADAVQAALFALFHLPGWIVGGVGLRTQSVSLVSDAAFAFALGLFTRRNGSIWLCVAVHWLTNLFLVP